MLENLPAYRHLVIHTSRVCHMFTRLYIFEYTFNNMEDVSIVGPYFENSTFGAITRRSGGVGILLVVGGSDRVTENGPVDNICFRI